MHIENGELWISCVLLKMKHDELRIKEFDYNLPDEKIAKYPLPNRDESKLLVYKEGTITESTYQHVAEFLPANAFLIFNNTKVVEVRLLFTKATGSTIELFCLEPADDYKDITTAMLQRKTVRWKCLVGGAKKWKEETLASTVPHGNSQITLQAQRVGKLSDSFIIEFSWDDDTLCFADVLHLFGRIPLPPYLNRSAEEEDKDRYQTIYAKWDGSVAAPTAGLHFTDAVFNDLRAKNIETGFVTLHVGAGTFKPVKTEKVAEHQMHAEFIEVGEAFIETLLAQLAKTIVVVGTTSLRTVESLYWLGVKTIWNEDISVEDLFLSQWEVYDMPQNVDAQTALSSLLHWMRKMSLPKLFTKTQIIILPGYQLRVAHGLITNFHQPQSTLLLLIAAIVGNNWREVYDYALTHDFRFLSYGDGSLLWRNG